MTGKKESPKTRRASGRLFLAISLTLLVASGACKNPFQSGLGDKVDIDRPIVTLDAPSPGQFLRGQVSFEGSASDDTAISAVLISINGGPWLDVDSYNAATKRWTHTIDTLSDQFDDRIVVRIRAIDNTGKETTTEELSFPINNAIPFVLLQVPAPEYTSSNEPIVDPDNPLELDLNGTIRGTVSDIEGIAAGYPRIQFWPAASPEPDSDPDSEDWVSLRPDDQSEPYTFGFSYALKDLDGIGTGLYHLRFLVKGSGEGRQAVVFPDNPNPFSVNIVAVGTPPQLKDFAFEEGTVTTFGGNNYARANFSFSVTASDTNGLVYVSITRNGVEVLGIDQFSSTEEVIVLPETVSGQGGELEDGSYDYQITVAGTTGLEADISRSVVVDTTPPEVEITNLRPTVLDDTDLDNIVERVNGTIQFNVAAGDENGLQAVRWWLRPSADAVPGFDSSGANAFATAPFVALTDTTTLTDQTAYTLYIIARDRAGNDTIVSREIIVDQASDSPTADFTDIDPAVTNAADAGVGGVNLLDTNARIRGVIEDDDRVDPSTIEIRLNGVTWIPVETVGPAGRSVSFSHKVDALGDGVHNFEMRFADDPSAKLGTNPPTAQTEVGPIWFVIDTAPPAVSISSPGPGTFQNAPFTLSGTAADANGLERHDFGGAVGERGFVEIETADNPGTWQRVAVDPDDENPDTWTFLVGDDSPLFGGGFEGQSTVRVRARDRFNKQTTTEFSFTIDTIAATVTVQTPLVTDWLAGASDAVQGLAADSGSGVAQVRVWVGEIGSEPPAEIGDWTLATGTSSWSSAINLAALGEGRRVAHVRARDTAGNWSATQTREFGIDQSSPTVTETVIGSSSAGRNVEFSLGGTLSDSNRLHSLVVTQQKSEGPVIEIYRNDGLDGTSYPWSVVSLPRDSDADDPTVPDSHVDDGVYRYVITVTDAADKTAVVERTVRVDLVGPEVTIMSPTPGASVQGTALLISGTAVDVGDVSSIKQVRYWYGNSTDDPPVVDEWLVAQGGSNWSATLDFPTQLGPGEEGQLTLHVIAQDTADNWSEEVETVDFTLDQNPPTISGFAFGPGQINTVGSSNYARDSFDFSFTAGDTNELASYSITRNGEPLAGHSNVAISGTSHPVSVSQTAADGGLADGDYEYVITVRDVVNKTASLTRSVVVDTTPPDLEITNLRPTVEDGETVRVNGTVALSVASGDVGGLLGVKWWIVENGDPAPENYDSDDGELFVTSPYKALLDTTGLEDNTEYTFYVIARDRALNETQVSMTVLVDQSSDDPVVTFTDIDPAITSAALLQQALFDGEKDNLLELNARIRGVIEDDDRVDASTIQISLNSDNAFGDVSSKGSSGRSVNFSHSLTELPDAVHFFYLRFSDDPSAKLGDSPPQRTTTVGPIYVVIDTENPAVTFTSPAVNSYQTDNFIVSGTAGDASGITAVELSIDGTTFNPVTDTSGEDPAYATWSHPVDISAISDGIVTVAVRARDAFDKSTIIERQVTVDRTAPEVTIIEPLDESTVNNGVRIRGTTADNFEIHTVYRWIGPQGMDAPDPLTELQEWTAFENRYSWEYIWDTFAYQDEVQGDFEPQDYTIHVVARDAAGNWSTIQFTTVTVDQASNRPVIELSSIDAEASAADNLLPTNLRISGTVEDDDAVDRNTIQVRIEELQGEAEVFGWTSISGTPSGSNPFVTWSHTFSGATALADGQYRLFVRAADINDSGYGEFTSSQIGPIEFAVDLANPTGSITSPTQGGYVNQDTVVISGTAFDANGIVAVHIAIDGGPELLVDDDAAPGEPDFSLWSYSYDASLVEDGQISYQVTLTDSYNKTTTFNRSFILDRQAPVVSFTQPAAEAVVNGSLLVRGTAEDQFSVSQVRFAVQRLSEPDAEPEPQFPADYTSLSGTFSWDFRINTTEYADGDYRIFIVAADAAGNSNAEEPATLDVSFDQSTNLPQITVSNASADSETPTLFGVGGTILGTITDDDGVDHTSIEISFDDGETWQPVSNPPSSAGVSVNFSHSLATVAERLEPYTVRVRASDIGEIAFGVDPVQDVSGAVYIGVDRNDPALAVTQLDIVDPYGGDPRLGVAYAPGMLVLDDFTLRGTASDASGIASLSVSIDGGAPENATYDEGSGTWSFDVGVTREPGSDGPMSITVQAVDGWGRTTTNSYNIVIDTTEPLITFTEPGFAASVNGTVTFRGTTSDANAITALGLELGRYDDDFEPVLLENLGTILSWRAVVDSNDYANDQNLQGGAGVETEPGSNVWLVPFVVSATDAAGNRAVEERELRVDPDSDKPIVAITAPGNNSSVATEFVFQGTITDDDPPPMRVALWADSNDDGTFDVDLGEISDITSGAWTRIVDTTDTDIFPVTPAGYIRLQAVPYDQFDTEGDPREIRVFVDTLAPVVSIISPATGSIVRGEITVEGTFRDDQELSTSQMRISLDGGNSYNAITSIAGASITGPAMVDGQFEYTFSVPIDTPTQLPNGNGILQIAVRVTDATFKQNTAFLELSVDNTRPSLVLNYNATMEFVGSGDNIIYTFDGNEAAGGNFIVIGSAEDDGIVSGIERVDIYLVKNGQFLAARDGVSALDVTTADVRDQDGVLHTIPYRVPEPRAGDGVLEDDYVISIDNRFERGIYDSDLEFGDQDGFQESLRSIGAIDEWYVYLDTTVLPDGPFTLYAVVYDLAGNTSFISAAAQAANYPPAIPSVTVGAQNLSGSADKAKVQGSVNFVINAEDSGLNPGIEVDSFRLTVDRKYLVGSGGAIGAEQSFTPLSWGSHAGADADFDSRVPTSGSAVTASAEIEIDTSAFDSGFWYRFVAEVQDSDGNTVTRSFFVWINNDDNLAPVVTIDNFTQASVSGLPGHLEEETTSPAAPAALSGTVRVTGTIYDDTAVDSLNLEISYNGGTDWQPLATVNSFGESISGDVISGYTYAWSYEWDTATITGVAQEGVLIRAAGNDGNNVTEELNRPLVEVDVVPYITNLLTGLDTGLRSLVRRSALGRYPVAVGSVIGVRGYNLGGGAAGVTVGGSPATVTGGSNTEITVNLGTIETSGELVATVNGVDSRNHTNDNSLPQNQEPSAYNDHLTDNRYIAFWRRQSHTARSNVQDAVMRPTGSGNAFDWMFTSNSNQLNVMEGGGAPLTVTRGNALSGGDFTRNADGSLMFAFNHNNQWTSVADSYRYVGGVNWGVIPSGLAYTFTADRDESYNWHLNGGSGTGGLPRLGLGNASFIEHPAALTLPDAYATLNINRYRNIRVETVGGDDATHSYIAYFDQASESRSVVFYGFRAGTAQAQVAASGNVYLFTGANNTTVSLRSGWYANIDKYFTRQNNGSVVALSGNQANNDTGIATPRGRMEIGVAGADRSGNSEFFDLGVHVVDATTHYGFIAYYDAAASELRMVYNKNLYTADPLSAASWPWSSPITIDTAAGAHVAMAIDPDGGIHLAYQDTASSQLKYSYVTFNDSTDNFSVVEQVYVDTLIASGQYNSITVRDFDPNAGTDYRPVITTYSSAFAGTNVALRTAYPMHAPGSAQFGAGANEVTGKFTGLWESVAAPGSTAPHAASTFTFTDEDGRMHIGYNGAYLEENTYLGE